MFGSDTLIHNNVRRWGLSHLVFCADKKYDGLEMLREKIMEIRCKVFWLKSGW